MRISKLAPPIVLFLIGCSGSVENAITNKSAEESKSHRKTVDQPAKVVANKTARESKTGKSLNPEPAEVAGKTPAASTAKNADEPLTAVDLIKEVEKSVVRFDVTTTTGRGIGSGFVASTDGLILTNYHVVAGAKSATVSFADKSTHEVLGVRLLDKKKDIAVVAISLDSAPSLRLDSKNQTPKGAEVLAFGAPKGLSFTASNGMVSAIRSGEEMTKLASETMSGTWIQTTAPISPGNSGGPLVNMDGQVVGINTMLFVGGQNLNFAISGADLSDALQRASKEPLREFAAIEPPAETKRTAQRSFPPIDLKSLLDKSLGAVDYEKLFVPFDTLSVTDLPAEERSKGGFKRRTGMVVRNVKRGATTLLNNDVIITIEKKPIKTKDDFLEFLKTATADTEYSITVYRFRKRTSKSRGDWERGDTKMSFQSLGTYYESLVKKRVDEFTGATSYTTSDSLRNLESQVSISFHELNGKPKNLGLTFLYYDDDWIFMSAMGIRVGETRHQLSAAYDDVKRKVIGRNVFEIYQHLVLDPSLAETITNIPEAEDVVIRLAGKDGVRDVVFSDQQKLRVAELLHAIRYRLSK